MSAEENKPAPAFSLAGSDGKIHALKDHTGQWVVLYFYPKDDTPGCTIEAQDFRDAQAKFKALGAIVLGVSKDDFTSHCAFSEKYKLNFTLLIDPDGKVMEAYGAWGEKNMYGKKSMGVIRSTYLIDPKGVLVKAWRSVKVDGHAAAVLAQLESRTAA